MAKRTPKRNLYGKMTAKTSPFCFLAYGERGAVHFFRASKNSAARNGGAASRTSTPTHGVLRGILKKKVHQRTAALAEYHATLIGSSTVLSYIQNADTPIVVIVELSNCRIVRIVV